MQGKSKDTIGALASAIGTSGVAVIRLSGSKSLAIVSELSGLESTQFTSHKARRAFLKVPGSLPFHQRESLDDTLILWMKAPHSFTGEEVVEIHCHGSMLIVRRILEACFSLGARAALPGEFSLRAYQNHKMDLVQAEAVQALIHAKNEWSMKMAQSQLEGRLSKLIESFQKDLTLQAAILEAWVDFPEEGLEFATFDQVAESIAAIQQQIKKLLETYHEGRLINDGMKLCLLGRPNVGKSSLMNALLRQERSIVTDIAGTTRDSIEEEATLCGLNFRLIDTAGVREASEKIEQEGIRRTWLKVKEADLVLWMLDAHMGLTDEDRVLLEKIPHEKTILVWNKCDLPHGELPDLGLSRVVHISASQTLGLDKLQELIQEMVWRHGMPDRDELLLTNLRHKMALTRCCESLDAVQKGLKERLSAEFVASDMRQSLLSLAEIIGRDITEDIITAVFSTFCLGK